MDLRDIFDACKRLRDYTRQRRKTLAPFVYRNAGDAHGVHDLEIIHPEAVTYMDITGVLPRPFDAPTVLLVRAAVDNYYIVYETAEDLEASVAGLLPVKAMQASSEDYDIFKGNSTIMDFLSTGEGGRTLKSPLGWVQPLIL